MTIRKTLEALMAKRILIIDGAMGTMIQSWLGLNLGYDPAVVGQAAE